MRVILIYKGGRMKILVTGSTGLLGSDVLRVLKTSDYDVLGVSRTDMDLTSKDQVEEVILGFRPHIIIHTAAYTNVEAAENNVKICMDTNVYGTMHIAYYAKLINATLIYISTDYVFDGLKDTPYCEDDSPNPLNIYGVSKLKGERVVKQLLDNYFIIRTSWLFGVNGDNFVKKMVATAKEKSEIKVVSDQVGSPTYTYDLAQFILNLIPSNDYGIYHVVNDGYLSWYGLSILIFNLLDKDILVSPIPTNKYNSIVKRPLNSRLSTDKLVKHKFNQLPSIINALNRYFIEESFT